MIALAAHDLKHLYRFLGIWGSASEAYCPARLGQGERLRYAYSGTDRRCYEQVAHRSVLWTERRIGASSAVYEHMVRWQDRGGYAASSKRREPNGSSGPFVGRNALTEREQTSPNSTKIGGRLRLNRIDRHSVPKRSLKPLC